MTFSWNSQTVELGLREIADGEPKILRRFADLLNDYHHEERDIAYWDLIGGEWALHFTHAVYAALQGVDDTSPRHTVQRPIPVFADHQDFMATITSDTQFIPALSVMAEKSLRSSQAGNATFSGSHKIIGAGLDGLLLRSRRTAKQCLYRALTGSAAPFLFCRPYIRSDLTKWYGTLRKWRGWARQDDLDYPIQTTASLDSNWRTSRSSDMQLRDWTDVTMALLPLYMPLAYLEGFVDYRRRAHALRLRRPRAMYTANSLHGHLLFKVLAADWRGEGTLVLNHQHGGGYGIDRIHPLEEYESRVACKFYSWGWSERTNQRPLSPASICLDRRPSKRTHRILVNCMDFPQVLYRIHFHPMPGSVDQMLEQTATFIASLRGVSGVTVRPYLRDYGHDLLGRLKRTETAFEIDDSSVGGPAAYARSALVVHNYLGTAWLETLAMNVPTVCFFDSQTYAFRSAAQPFIDRLVDVGVLHTSAIEAADHVRSICNDPSGWWTGPEVQSARENFVRQYANFSPNWMAEWQEEFQRCLS